MENMSGDGKAILGDAILTTIREAVRLELEAHGQNGKADALLTPEELAACLKVPKTWVYEQSRLGNIPTHRLGHYIRFDLREVLASQNGNGVQEVSITAKNKDN